MSEFDTTDTKTWPTVLTAVHVSAIYQRRLGGVKHACQEGRFVPAPFLKRPWRWRKSDVVRHVEGARGGEMRRAS